MEKYLSIKSEMSVMSVMNLYFRNPFPYNKITNYIIIKLIIGAKHQCFLTLFLHTVCCIENIPSTRHNIKILIMHNCASYIKHAHKESRPE